MSEHFQPINVLLKEEFDARLSDEVLPFGVPFLDTVLGGILPTDLVLIGAPTGRGKSELAVDIAFNAASNEFKRVHVFALEAERFEVHRRMKYKIIAQRYYEEGGTESLNYQSWRLQEYPQLLKYEQYADQLLSARCANLSVYYRDSSFDIDKFSEIFSTLQGQSSLVLLDHLGYLDINGENENKAYGDIMKKIKDLTQLYNIPVVAIAHLRKTDKKQKTLLSSIDDFHGTSNLVKIATRVVVLGNGGMSADGKPITYMRVLKNRLGGERLHVVGKTLYDTKKNCYIGKVKYGFLNADETEWTEFDKGFEPHWLVPK